MAVPRNSLTAPTNGRASYGANAITTTQSSLGSSVGAISAGVTSGEGRSFGIALTIAAAVATL